MVSFLIVLKSSVVAFATKRASPKSYQIYLNRQIKALCADAISGLGDGVYISTCEIMCLFLKGKTETNHAIICTHEHWPK